MDVSGNLAQLERHTKILPSQMTFDAPIETTIPAPANPIQVSLVIDTATQGALDMLPVYVARYLRPLIKRGHDVKARHNIAAGAQPFDASVPRWIQLAGERLVKFGGFSKAELRDLFITEFGWTEGTAFSRVSIVAGLLPALRIAAVSGDRIVLAPSVVGKN
jgi:hypothetical protein